MFKFALTLIAYAAALLAIGYLTYTVAPPGSNAKTALIAPAIGAAAALVCAVLSLIRSDRKLCMIGIHLGLILPLLMALGPTMRLSGSLSNTAEFNKDFEAAKSITLIAEGDGERHNTAYQTVGLGASSALSLFAFLALLSHRPPAPKRRPAPIPATTTPPASSDDNNDR